MRARGDGVYFGEFVGGEVEVVEGGEAAVHLLDGAGADDDAGDALVAQGPGEGHLGEGLAAALGYLVEAAAGGDDLGCDLLGAQEAFGTGGQGSDAVTLTYRIWPKDVQPLLPATAKLADVSDHKAYALYNAHFTAYATYDENQSTTALWTAGMIGDSGHALSNPEYSTPLNVADPCSAWMLVNYDGKNYLYNIGAEKFLKTGQPCTLVAEPQPIKVTAVSGGFAFVNEGGGSQDYMCASPQLNPPHQQVDFLRHRLLLAVPREPQCGRGLRCLHRQDRPVRYRCCRQPTVNSQLSTAFDLTGRAIRRESRGIYLRAGKKVVVK